MVAFDRNGICRSFKPRPIKRSILAPFLLFLCSFPLLVVAGCTPASHVNVNPGLKLAPEQGLVHIVPFTSTLVPQDFAETFFNTFVDNLNGNREGTGIRWFYIAKEDPKELDPGWLSNQVYVTGETWGYLEELGCCSAEIRVKGRIKVFEPGKSTPSLEIYIPLEHFFEYNKTTVEAERQNLALQLADEMAEKLILALRNPS